jgi:hypothetical protein
MDIQFSYLSRCVDESRLELREVNEKQALVGRYNGASKDVFIEYYAARKRHRGGPAPHYEFASCRATPEGIRAFTAKWGTLGFSAIIRGTPSASQFEPWMGFFMQLEEWQEAQEHFRQMLNLAKSRVRTEKNRLIELLDARGSLNYLTIGSSSSPRILWDRSGTLRVRFAAGSLWEAFCLMLVEDLASTGSRIKQCADPKCEEFFETTRSDKKFCSAEHASRFHKRKWSRKQRRLERSRK